MKQGEIIEMAKRLGITVELASHPAVKQLINEVVKQTEDRFMQLFLDPENQPTQFGTATEEYREQELKEAKTLLKELAHIVRTTHLYGPEMKKILEKEEVINGEASSSL